MLISSEMNSDQTETHPELVNAEKVFSRCLCEDDMKENSLIENHIMGISLVDIKRKMLMHLQLLIQAVITAYSISPVLPSSWEVGTKVG